MSSSSPPPPPDGGQEKVIAAAKHIVKSLAVSKNAADDMISILSGFDTRLYTLSSPTEGDGSYADDEEEREAFAAAEDIIRRCDSSSSDRLGCDMADYLAAIDDAITVAFLSGDLAARAAAAVHAGMSRLEDELRFLLLSGVSLCRLSLSSDDLDATPDASPSSDALSPRAAASLRNIADRMLRAGYGPELEQVYVATRRDALAESLAPLGVENISIEEVLKMEWAVLDKKMRRWSHAVKILVKSLLAGERRLCDQVFAADDELGGECFTDVTKGFVLQLLGFADAVAMSGRAPEKLYRMLGMYEALAEVKPELEALFFGDAREFVADEVRGILAQLGDMVRRTIEEFGSAIQGEPSRKSVHGGEIHPMTRYVLNYCGLLADCRSTLDMVLDDGVGGGDGSVDGANLTPSGRCMLELLTYLLQNIDEKSRLYDDVGLQNIFLMNNLYYIIQKVRDSALKELLGDDWIRRRRRQIRQYETGYLRASWINVLSYLRDDSSSSPSNAYKGRLKGKIRNFNVTFEELYRNQTSWKVSDPQLREELRIAVSERLIPAYRSFLGQSRSQLETGRQPTKNIKYSLEDLENYMLDFFEGVPKLVK